MNTKLLYAMLVVVLAGLACRADTVYLTDGTEADGTIVEESATTVVVKRANGVVQSFRRGDVDAVVYEKKAPAAAARTAEVVPPAPEPKKAVSVPKEEGAKPAVAVGTPTPEPSAAKAKEGEAKPGETAAAPREGAAKPGETAAAAKEGAAKPGETAAAQKQGEAQTKKGETAAKETKTKTKEGKEAEAGKEGTADTTAEAEGESKTKETAEGDGEKEKELTSPPGPSGLPNFPDHVKRMKKDKEEAFMTQLEKLASPEKPVREQAKAAIGAMGPAVLPYVVAGCNNDNVDARALCMLLVGDLGGRVAIKQVIELFYAAMPYSGQADDFQGPFIQAIKNTLAAITGQSFITAELNMPGVQDGLKQYIDWYNKNIERLPPQLGEKQVDPADPDYAELIMAGRKLSLVKKSWPRPVTTSDLIQGIKDPSRVNPTVDEMIRPSDKAFEKTIPMIPFKDIGKRGN